MSTKFKTKDQTSQVYKTMVTISEQYFEKFCNMNAINYSRIPPVPNLETADYLIDIEGYKLIVEVTEFEINKEEKEKLKELVEKKIMAQFTSTEKRIRSKISKKSKQLRNLVEKYKLPSVLLLYDNRSLMADIDSESIKYGMYGEDAHILFIHTKLDLHTTYKGNKFGKHRRMTETEKNYISAIGHLVKNKYDKLKIYLYHNFYASHPIEYNKISKIVTKQYKIDEPHKTNQKNWQLIEI